MCGEYALIEQDLRYFSLLDELAIAREQQRAEAEAEADAEAEAAAEAVGLAELAEGESS